MLLPMLHRTIRQKLVITGGKLKLCIVLQVLHLYHIHDILVLLHIQNVHYQNNYA